MCADYLRGLNSFAMVLSSGGTKAYLRREPFEQFICQYDGATTYTLAGNVSAECLLVHIALVIRGKGLGEK